MMTPEITIADIKAADRLALERAQRSDHGGALVTKAVANDSADDHDLFAIWQKASVKDTPVRHGLFGTIMRELTHAMKRVNQRLDLVERRSGSVLDSRLKGMEVTPQSELIKTLQVQVKNLSSRTNGVCFYGEFNPRITYPRESAVQFRGSLFICKALETTSTPGTDDTWVLALQGGTTSEAGGDGPDDPSRIEQLERRIAELERRPVLRDAGVWKANTTYEAGDIASFDGGAWICNAAHVSVGRTLDHERFRLLVMRGARGPAGESR